MDGIEAMKTEKSGGGRTLFAFSPAPKRCSLNQVIKDV